MSAFAPPLLIEILATPEVFVAGMVGVLIGLAPFALMEWTEKRRARREQIERDRRELDLATDFLMLVGFLEDEQAKRLPDDTQ